MAIDRDGDGPPLFRDEASKPRAGVGDDLRATAFTDDVFNDDYYARRPAASKGGRGFSMIAGVAIGLVIVGGVAWYALKGGVMDRLVPGEPEIVEADPTPYKIKPENPGGMQVENQDKLVYDRVAKGAAPNRVENLLPPAEEPKAPPQKPQVAAAPEPEKKELEALVKTTQEPAKVPVPAPAPEAPKPAQVAEAKPEPPKPAEAPKPATDPLVAAVAAATGKPVEIPKAEAPAETKPAETNTAAVTPAAAPVAGAFQVQLVSVPSEEAANSEWKRITRRHQDLFASLSPNVTKAELPEKGTVYRLRAGPLADKAAADALCASLAAERTGCIVIKP
jgi:hypothetical protein